MTAERMAELVARWVRSYTRDLPTPIAERRVDEIDADLHDEIAHERANGISDRRIVLGIASRMVRGLAADVAWRGHHAKAAARPSTVEEAMKISKAVYRSAVRVALGVALILSLPLVAMLITDDVVWSLVDFVGAGVLLTVIGIAIELAVRKAGNLATALGIAALGVAAALFGEADDAPGLVLIGILLIASACALGVRTAQRSR
ncbi:MAG: hypothetical protein ACRDJ9_02220 [Dehalococcoidia bacterium]